MCRSCKSCASRSHASFSASPVKGDTLLSSATNSQCGCPHCLVPTAYSLHTASICKPFSCSRVEHTAKPVLVCNQVQHAHLLHTTRYLELPGAVPQVDTTQACLSLDGVPVHHMCPCKICQTEAKLKDVCRVPVCVRVAQSVSGSYTSPDVSRGDTSQLALLSATEDDSFHPLAVIETIKRLGDLSNAAFRYARLRLPHVSSSQRLILLQPCFINIVIVQAVSD